MSAQPQPRFGPPWFDVRIERAGAQRFVRADPIPGLIRIDFDPPASGPEAELTFGTTIGGVDPVDEDFLRAEVERISGFPVLAIRRRDDWSGGDRDAQALQIRTGLEMVIGELRGGPFTMLALRRLADGLQELLDGNALLAKPEDS